MNNVYLLVTLYIILFPAFLYTTNAHKKIQDFYKKIIPSIRNHIKQYIEYMDSVPLKYSVGK